MKIEGRLIEIGTFIVLSIMAREVALLLGVPKDSIWGLLISTYVVVFIMAGYSKKQPGGKN